MPSPLFPNFNRYQRELEAAKKRLAETVAKAKQAQGGYRSGQPMRYGGAGGGVWRSIIRSMGSWGGFVDSLFRGSGKQVEADIAKELEEAIKAAQDLLEARKGAATLPQSIIKGIERKLIEEEPKPATSGTGGPSKPPTRRTEETPAPEPRREEPEQEPQQEDITEEVRQGRLPIQWVTGFKSSNVYRFGYEWADNERMPGTLYVQYLGGDSKHRAGPGATYKYEEVPRSVFVAMTLAASKGKFIWSEIRIRGSVSAHNYAYDLVGTGPGGYIPRQAVISFRGRASRGGFATRKFQGRESTLKPREFRGGRALTANFRGKASNIRFRSGRE